MTFFFFLFSFNVVMFWCFSFFLCSQRFPDDVYDRIWTPYNSADWNQIDTLLTIDQGATSFNFLPLPPSTVMGTAAIPANVNDGIELRFVPVYNSSTLYVYMFFAEIQKLEANQTREFNIFVNGNILNIDPINLPYLQSEYYMAISENSLELSINKTSRSTLPPLLNAIEIYTSRNFSQSETKQKDGMFLDMLILLSYITLLYLHAVLLLFLTWPTYIHDNSWWYHKCQVNVWNQEKLASRSLYSTDLLMGRS